MSEGPPPPSHLTPEYLNAYSGNTLLAVAIAFIVLCTICCSLRLFGRTYVRDAPLGWDDFLMVPAYIMQVALCVCGILHVKEAAVGYHIEKAVMIYGEADAIARWGKILFAVYFFWDWATVFPRLALICLYLRIFSNNTLRIASWALMVFIVAYGFAFQFAAIFACWPVSYAWDRSQHGSCFNIQLFFQLSTLPLIVSDIPLLLLPLPFIWRLEMPKVKKIGIIFTFLTGSFGLVASCLRLALFFSSTVLTDPTWDSAKIITWTIVEPGLYCVAACLIAMRPVASVMVPKGVAPFTKGLFHRAYLTTGVRRTLSKRLSSHDPSIELGGFNGRRGRRGNGFGPLDDLSSKQPIRTEAGAFADTSSLDERIDNLMWPSREFENAIHVKKEVWVSKSPFPE